MDYRNEVLRTAGGHADRRNALLNVALGLAGEAGEVAEIVYVPMVAKTDKALLIKELGDLRWYLEYGAHTLGMSREELAQRVTGESYQFNHSKEIVTRKLLILVSQVADHIKKYAFHKHDLNEFAVKGAFTTIYSQIHNLAGLINTPLRTVEKRNVEKLQKRYPNGFTPEDSINRVNQ